MDKFQVVIRCQEDCILVNYYISNGDFIPELLSLDTSMWFIVYTLLPMQIVDHKTVTIHSNSCVNNIWVAGLQIQLDLLSLFY